MNVSAWVEWAERMLATYSTLPCDFKQAYSFLLDYKELIADMGAVSRCIKYIEAYCKTNGFSKFACRYCVSHVIRELMKAGRGSTLKGVSKRQGSWT